MKTNVVLELHNDEELHAVVLDSNDIYEYVSERTIEEVELALYVDKWCTYLNYHILNNREMAFGDVDYARLEGWITGYNHAKKIDVRHFTDRVEIKMRKYFIVLKKPFIY